MTYKYLFTNITFGEKVQSWMFRKFHLPFNYFDGDLRFMPTAIYNSAYLRGKKFELGLKFIGLVPNQVRYGIALPNPNTIAIAVNETMITSRPEKM